MRKQTALAASLVLFAVAVSIWVARRDSSPAAAKAGTTNDDAASNDHGFGAQQAHEAMRLVPPVGNQASDGLQLRFVDESGHAIDGAFVWRALNHELADASLIGTSDAEGNVVLDPPVKASSMIAQHLEYAPARFAIADEEHGDRFVTMVAGRTLGGYVITSAGEPVTERPRVLVFSAANPPTKAEIALAMTDKTLSSADARVVAADENGGFLVRGLAPADDFFALVGGSVASAALQGPFAADRQDIVLIADPLFAVRARVRERGNDSVRTAAALWQPPGPQWTWNRKVAAGVGTDSLQAVLSGVAIELTSRRPGADLLMLFTAPADTQRVGPIDLRGTLAGYAPCAQEIWAERLRGSIAVADVELDPVATEWGELAVEFTDARRSPDARSSTRHEPIGSLWLEDVRSSNTWEYALFELDGKPIELRGVPSGRYRVTLNTAQSYHRFASTPPEIDIVGRGETVSIAFDLSAACTVEIRLFDEQGRAHRGEAVVQVGRERGDGRVHTNFFVFERAPYVLYGLLAEKYRFIVDRPMAAERWVDLATAIDDSRLATLDFLE